METCRNDNLSLDIYLNSVGLCFNLQKEKKWRFKILRQHFIACQQTTQIEQTDFKTEKYKFEKYRELNIKAYFNIN